MRLMLVCAALCFGCPINASSDRHNRQEPYPQAVAAAAATVSPIVLASYSAPDFTPRTAVEAETGPQEDVAKPDPSERAIAPDPAEPERAFSRRELCSTAAAVAKRH